ncbi:MAG: RagB/SusD family nutrient uptake outer membrane protein [Prevotella sp.]|uniref:RagB/SusD family nutrient uptake outer membrane protein n=1 Tax=Prevotella sp. PTAC TaxID=2736295 RepID=UPI00155474A6|nr:RagB/SusD family nutrient uptake outer membrane protein [Prevotella sp. PTAC]MCX4293665.1 RagB/SusD family nutrient uptake outer membrane protein [Prevotella sp.]NPD54858.1 RagB/SusD family nutrient uptake outer membrane protein [Prevotella sp. PTAC]
MKKTINNIIIALGASFGLTSCSDFLDILPLNDVVLENYWTEKSDVTSNVNGCYEALEINECINRLGLWGEIRSENMRLGTNVPNEVNEILKENILPSNPYCSWAAIYDVINRCNTVCHYAPGVQAIDPNYTEDEMRSDMAQASAIRALCYFYLIRTFRDVPYSKEPSIDDAQRYIIPASSFETVLDTCIADLEKVKDDAVRRYYADDSNNAYRNSSRITRQAIYALLADMYLWKGDYDKCIHYCDLVLDFKRNQYDEMVIRDGAPTDIALFGDIPMILDKPVGRTQCGNSYNSIFGSGNSFESIFEIYFRTNTTRLNTWVGRFYVDGANSNNGYLSAPDFLRKDVAVGNHTIFKKTDCRAYSSVGVDGSRYFISKYVYQNVSFKNQNITSEKDLGLMTSKGTPTVSNWIFYRLSDVILMKAEAEIERGAEDGYKKAFALINTVNKRANDVTNTSRSDTLKMEDYVSSKESMEELLLAERHREFLYEGKRWFDLVRFARRDGNNDRLITLATRKYIENVNAIKIKLANPNIIYFPYSKSELKANPLLKQNPAYMAGEDSELTK